VIDKIFYKTRIFILFLPLLFLISSGCGDEEESIWFGNLDVDLVLSQADLENLGDYISNRLDKKDLSSNSLQPRINSDVKPRILFISVSDSYSAASVFIGKGKGLLNAIENCIVKLNNKLDEDYVIKWIKVDIVSDVIGIEINDLDKALIWDRSLFGLAFNKETGIALLPEEITTYTIIDSKQKLNKKKLFRYLRGDSHSIEIEEETLFIKNSQIFRFLTYSFFLEDSKFITMYRGHRMFEKLSSHEILDAASNGGKYLVKAVKPNGKFMYSYLPKTSKEKKKYNIVRHAGTIYSMLQLYEATGENELLEKSGVALEYLISNVKTMAIENGDFICIVENGKTKLGGNALTVIALLKYYTQTKEQNFLDIAIGLGDWILASQNKEGEFVIQTQLFSSGEVTKFRSQYYPGEALLALVRLFQTNGQFKWLNAAESGAKFLINIRDGMKEDNELAHDHWLLYALNELYRFRPNKIYLDHSMRLANAILNSQRDTADFRDWNGSFYTPPRSTPTATRMEGLYAAYQLARDYNNDEMRSKIRKGLERGIRFQLQTQFRPETAIYLNDPQRAMGGFKRSLTNYEIRIDYVQHNISSLLGMFDVLTENRY